jgi:hypothetical protein
MNKPIVILALAATCMIIRCNETENPSAHSNEEHHNWPRNSVVKSESYSKRINAELLSDDSIHEGYDSLAVVFRDAVSGAIFTYAQTWWFPLSDMGEGMSHSAPVDLYGVDADEDSLFRCGVDFIMSGQWILRLRIRDNRYPAIDMFNDSVDFHFRALPVSTPYRLRWIGPDGFKRVAVLILPEKPVIGVNDLELFVSSRVTGFDWPPDSLWTVTFTTTMLSMGHGSSGNVNPAHAGGAHYRGKVNFTMSGDWRLTFKFQRTDSSFITGDTSLYLDLKVN